MRKKLGEILVQAGVINDGQLMAALGEQRNWGGRLGASLVKLGFCKEDAIVRALHLQLGLPLADFSKEPDPLAMTRLPASFCQKHKVMPFAFEATGKVLDVAMADPTNLEVVDEIRAVARASPRPHIAGLRAIEQAIRVHYLGESPGDGDSGLQDTVGMDLGADSSGELETVSSRVETLEARIARDEHVLRNLMRFLVEKGLIDRQELQARLKQTR